MMLTLLAVAVLVGVLVGFGLGMEYRDRQAFVKALNPKERR